MPAPHLHLSTATCRTSVHPSMKIPSIFYRMNIRSKSFTAARRRKTALILAITIGSLTRNDVSGTENDQTIDQISITLGANALWTINGSGTLTVSGIIDDGVSTFTLTKTGTGTLAFSGANSFGGATTIRA